MKLNSRIAFILIVLTTFSWNLSSKENPKAKKYPPKLAALMERMHKENSDLQLKRQEIEMRYQSVRGSKSSLWPSLSLTGAINQGQPPSQGLGTINGPTDAPAGGVSGGGASPPPPTTADQDLGDFDSTWGSQLSLSYFLYTKGFVSESIRRSKNDWQRAIEEYDVEKDKKEAQLISLIQEWQTLRNVMTSLEQAKKVFKTIENHKNKKSSHLYSKRDQLNFAEKKAQLDMINAKVTESEPVIFLAINELVPNVTRSELAAVKPIELKYDILDPRAIEEKYLKQARRHKILDRNIAAAQGYSRVAANDRPWIPYVYLSSSYSYSGNFAGASNPGDVSASLVLTFNLFDGFLASSRRQQANIALQASKTQKQVESNRVWIKLLYNRREYKVKSSEYAHKQVLAQKAEYRLKDLKRKRRQGFGSSLEVTLGELNHIEKKLDAHSSFLASQRALMNISIELNEWSKVTIL